MNPYAKFLRGRDPIEVAADTPTRIRALIRGLTPRQLAQRPAPGKWSIQEIITHLTETDMVMCCRARWIAFEESPTLVPFDQEKWAKGWARELVFQIGGLVFQKPGPYEFRLYANDRWVGSKSLRLVQAPEPGPPPEHIRVSGSTVKFARCRALLSVPPPVPAGPEPFG